MTDNEPDLRFGFGSSQGFTPVGIAAFDDLRPAAVVRELIQNSLDAARAAQIRPAKVCFQLTEESRDNIPGIKSYESVFHKAIQTQKELANGNLPRQAKIVVDRIKGALAKEKLDVLTVLDNGVGLNERRMTALLTDGLSVKEGNATGTYGNGHHTAIPTSDLRYVLYGGVTQGGKRIGAGHAVLASHIEEGQSQPLAGDGFYIRDFSAGKGGALYDYAIDDQVPSLIEAMMEEVISQAGHGTAVIIPAFNNFLETDLSLQDMVFEAISANFFVAIEAEDLEVKVEDCRPGGDSATLNKLNLTQILETYQGKRRSRAFLSGARAYEAHNAYKHGTSNRINTSAGDIEIRLQESLSGITRIDLCRNGMWITDKIPGFSGKFSDKIPFQAVLLLDAEGGRDFHNFIRDAEGPLHDKITMKHLPGEDRKKCRRALNEIIQWIINNTKSVQSEAFSDPDFLALDFGDEEGIKPGKAKRRFWGAPTIIKQNFVQQRFLFPPTGSNIGPDDSSSLKKNGKKNEDKKTSNQNHQRIRPSLPSVLQAVSRPIGKNRRRIVIECVEDYDNAEMRLVVNEALDATCLRHNQDTYTPAILSNVTINGVRINSSKLVHWDGEAIGIKLGDLKVNHSIEVEVDYHLTGDFAGLSHSSLNVELLKTADESEAES